MATAVQEEGVDLLKNAVAWISRNGKGYFNKNPDCWEAFKAATKDSDNTICVITEEGGWEYARFRLQEATNEVFLHFIDGAMKVEIDNIGEIFDPSKSLCAASQPLPTQSTCQASSSDGKGG